jgi:hypothetical protein
VPRELQHIVVVAMADFDLFVGDFQFTDFNNFAPPLLDPSMSIAHSQPNHYPLAPTYGSPASSLSPLAQGYDQALKKRKLDSVSSHATQQSLDENARVAAEEDKRRRNTAASARFRVKKKERERALEQSQKEAAERVAKLEATIQQLQTENLWLKGLITEKNESSTEELKALISKRDQAASERSSSTRTDGVGTEA